jgi:ABC-2 type transport system permease protein
MIRAELARQLGRPRTLLALAALAGFTLALAGMLDLTGPARAEPVGDIPLLVVPAASALAVPLIALSSTMKFFLPLAVSIFAGEAVAGEARWGSLRYLLARGVPRRRLLATKAAVAGLLALAAVVTVPAVALAAGLAIAGWQPLPVVDGSASGALHQVRVVVPPAAALLRLGAGTAYVAAGMAGVFAFAFFLSCLTARPLVAVAGGVGLAILSRLLNYDYLPGVAVLSPYLPTNDVDLWLQLFRQPVQGDGMLRFLALQAVYAGAFLTLAWAWFARRDVLT